MPTAGASTPPTPSPTDSGRRCCRGCGSEYADAWVVGEVIHGDYPATVHAAGFDSVTQYELWKAIWSSLNDGNFHELDHALQRHNEFLDAFVPMTFIGNHDVTRIASRLENTRHLEHALVDPADHRRCPERLCRRRVPPTAASRRNGSVATTRCGPNSGSPPMGVDEHGHDMFRLHQYLIGLRRRHPWLHTARTSRCG